MDFHTDRLTYILLPWCNYSQISANLTKLLQIYPSFLANFLVQNEYILTKTKLLPSILRTFTHLAEK